MFKELFINFTILATFLFFGNIFLNQFRKSSLSERSSAWLPWFTGVMMGFAGILLMEFSFPVSEHSIIDLRQTAIIIAVYVAGIPGGLVASIMIALFRFFFFGNIGLPSYIGAFNALATFALVIFIIKKLQLEPKRWAAAFAVQLLLLSVSLYITLGSAMLRILPIYGIIIAGTGLFTFLMLRHLRNSNQLFAFMEDAAHRDFLTGLYNPRAFHLLYDRRIWAAQKNGEEFSLILLDIDHFKKVNDTYGHPAGDLVLKQLGNILASCTPIDGYAARNGGEEFAMVIDRRDEESLTRITERIRISVESHDFMLEDGTTLKITISLGYGISSFGSVKTLFRRVDDALYHAKKSGRNRVCKAGTEIDPSHEVV
ncbi:diguanylate cyclase [Saccharibacillus sp. JS10]|uniref:diguanylate cyclase n=1 Tax=Saccharibacillus sp. JS10 TaxID=2950552 RepID=UPI002109C5CF|nr:diguanylate cyclase [Saccharibacillus sp. JS10]MCQ4088780.1 diguanylate cyclase [Saccharibacillus sp. JS10]